ncbi:MAG: hypothetical protein ABI288_04375 [Ginsengibacter sp.]
MKKYILVIILLLILTGFGSCKKHNDTDSLTQVPAPDWTMDTTGKYPLSMTAVVQVSPDITPDVSETDKIGAFSGDECRGIGTLVGTGNTSVFFILIHGIASEQSKISFKYYSSQSPHIYRTNAFLDFIVDGNYGTVDNPEVPDMKQVK